MKNLFFTLFLSFGSLAFASNGIDNNQVTVSSNLNETTETITECNTQTTQDSDGDTVTVTCCRTTYSEAFNCAADKLRKAVEEVAPVE